jgi:hypothetical protein
MPVMIVRSGLRAVLFGSGSGLLELRYLAANADVQPGDKVVTSGLDGVFLAGLPVATVARVERDQAQTFARIPACRRRRRAHTTCSSWRSGRACRRGRPSPSRRQAKLKGRKARPARSKPCNQPTNSSRRILLPVRCGSSGPLFVALFLNLIPLGHCPACPIGWRWCWPSGACASRSRRHGRGLRVRAADGHRLRQRMGQHALCLRAARLRGQRAVAPHPVVHRWWSRRCTCCPAALHPGGDGLSCACWPAPSFPAGGCSRRQLRRHAAVDSAHFVLLLPQYRPVERDENRPI